jgi:hypothetical protein
MIYVYRSRRLCRVIEQEIDYPTDGRLHGEGPDLRYCLALFMHLSHKYDQRVANKVLAYAGSKKYIKLEKSLSKSHKKVISLSGNGLELLTRIGYVNALGGAVGQVSPVISVAISLFALAVAILAVVK